MLDLALGRHPCLDRPPGARISSSLPLPNLNVLVLIRTQSLDRVNGRSSTLLRWRLLRRRARATRVRPSPPRRRRSRSGRRSSGSSSARDVRDLRSNFVDGARDGVDGEADDDAARVRSARGEGQEDGDVPTALNDVAGVGDELDDAVLFDDGGVAVDEVVELGREHGLHEVNAVRDDQAARARGSVRFVACVLSRNRVCVLGLGREGGRAGGGAGYAFLQRGDVTRPSVPRPLPTPIALVDQLQTPHSRPVRHSSLPPPLHHPPPKQDERCLPVAVHAVRAADLLDAEDLNDRLDSDRVVLNLVVHRTEWQSASQPCSSQVASL